MKQNHKSLLLLFFRKEGLSSCVALSLLTASASAHAILVDSTPAPLAHVTAGHLDVTLRYNSRIDAARSKLVLQQGDVQQRVPAAAGDTPDVLRASLDVAAGQFQLLWQVLATDGHVTRGRVPFTVDRGTVDAGAGAGAGAPR